jgi:hypothetical protein
MGLRIQKVALVAGLLAVGLFAASPFLTDRMLGSSEGYNYSLSVEDAVTQMRAGVLPPLAGQTVYAFNGRIHPLRNAPYLYYLAYALDVATLHRLPPWRLETLSLVLSVVAAAFACYLGLRWGTGCGRVPAFFLAAFYGLSAPLLCAAYTYNMYMTVHAAVFVPLAIGACMRGCLKPSFSADAWLAASLAAAWLAHPPVALWLTCTVVLVRLVAFALAPSWRTLARGTCAVLLAAALACFVFVSTASLGFPIAGLTGGEGWRGASGIINENVQSFFPGSLLPVSPSAGEPGDLQLGYVPWALFLLTVTGMFRADWRLRVGKGPLKSAALGSVAAVSLLLILMVPVPGITRCLWYYMPPAVLNLTNIWPNQRIYLVALPLIFFGAALVVPRAFPGARPPRWILAAAAVLALAWTAFEATRFIERGIRDRWSAEDTASRYRPSNIDLTITSYAFILTPPTFVYGVADPQTEFRLLRAGRDEIGSTISAGLATAPVVDRGSLQFGWFSTITLKPGKRYLLTFAFRRTHEEGALQLLGPLLLRRYALPSSGGPRAFGTLPGQRRTLSVWTDGDKPESVEISFSGSAPKPTGGPRPVFADYTLQELDPSRLPVRFEGYLPLRLGVDSPEMGCEVETAQRYLPGYEATVNGKPVIVECSPDGQVMVPVPKGPSEVAIAYTGPLSARIAFWICAGTWAAFLLWRLCGSWVPERPFSAVAAGCGVLSRHRMAACAAAIAVVLLVAAAIRLNSLVSFRRAAGPVEVDFLLPFGAKAAGNQPLLATGHPHAGAVVFVTCLDANHVRLGADVWGQLFQSGPIETDFSSEQQLVVSDSALFPVDNPRVRALDPVEIAKLRGEFRVELNGRTEILRDSDAYETTPSEVLAGKTRFGSITASDFQGEILGMRRLPIPREVVLPWGRRLRMTVTFPRGQVGISEPLMTGVARGATRSFYVTYLSDTRLRITRWSPEGQSARSAEVDFDPLRSHVLDIQAGALEGSPSTFAMSLSFDGKPVIGAASLKSSVGPPLVATGTNAAHVPGVRERFTGPRMDLAVVTAAAEPAVAETEGPVHMIVSLPADKIGRSEPLVATGRTGAGDIVFVTYVDPSHVRISLDHWGGAVVTSGLIPIDYGAPHEIWVSMDSLNSPPSAGSPVTVVLDGAAVLSSPIAPYPSTQAEVRVGSGLAGGSTEDPVFTGAMRFLERLGNAAVPRPGS